MRTHRYALLAAAAALSASFAHTEPLPKKRTATEPIGLVRHKRAKDPVVIRRQLYTDNSRYTPHQGKREMARRARHMRPLTWQEAA